MDYRYYRDEFYTNEVQGKRLISEMNHLKEQADQLVIDETEENANDTKAKYKIYLEDYEQKLEHLKEVCSQCKEIIEAFYKENQISDSVKKNLDDYDEDEYHEVADSLKSVDYNYSLIGEMSRSSIFDYTDTFPTLNQKRTTKKISSMASAIGFGAAATLGALINPVVGIGIALVGMFSKIFNWSDDKSDTIRSDFGKKVFDDSFSFNPSEVKFNTSLGRRIKFDKKSSTDYEISQVKDVDADMPEFKKVNMDRSETEYKEFNIPHRPVTEKINFDAPFNAKRVNGISVRDGINPLPPPIPPISYPSSIDLPRREIYSNSSFNLQGQPGFGQAYDKGHFTSNLAQDILDGRTNVYSNYSDGHSDLKNTLNAYNHGYASINDLESVMNNFTVSTPMPGIYDNSPFSQPFMSPISSPINMGIQSIGSSYGIF